MKRSLIMLFVLGSVTFQFWSCREQTLVKVGWPEIKTETKPWTRWWWHGNAVTKEGITAELEAYSKAGIGGVEITPIYGVHGYEDKFVDYLSPQWMELLLHTLKEADRLGMGVDMATGTGWPFGGQWVADEDACKNINFKMYELKAGETLKEKIQFTQQPLLRAIGNSAAQVPGTKQSVQLDPKTIRIERLSQPVSSNKDLQRLALDQIQFERKLPLHVLMAYSSSGDKINLTDQVDSSGKLNWVAPAGDWKLYALFQGWHGKMVERAGPGGEGNVIDHFSSVALKNYLARFDSAFQKQDIGSLRAFFNDSYEVDDARGAADWTPALFDEFKKRRGYDLRDYLPALLNEDDSDVVSRRVRCDYHETISELLLVNFTSLWKEWAYSKSAIVRNQAHGSPANILDLYATVDIPEIEGTESLRIKMASSAGNVTGKRLVSSESATWLDEHFKSNFGDVKVALDRFMLNGVNHLFYHGTSYSPPGEPWPGWLFYAAVHFNPRNPLWRDFDALNGYAARCQSFLQNTQSDNDVLLYYPIYDRFSTRSAKRLEHFDGIDKQFANTAFERCATTMEKAGYAFDYISDKQIANTTLDGEKLKTEGNRVYSTLVIPRCAFIPEATWRKILALADQGATVLIVEGLPSAYSGLADYEQSDLRYKEWVKTFETGRERIAEGHEWMVGKGKLVSGDSLQPLLKYVNVRREGMVDLGINFIRKKYVDQSTVYFVANERESAFDGWVSLSTEEEEGVVLYDPMTGVYGKAKSREGKNGATEILLQLAAKQSLIIQRFAGATDVKPFSYLKAGGQEVALNAKWKITFVEGGPALPSPVETDSLASWTNFDGEAYKAFSGTAIYKTTFDKPQITTAGWLLDLGRVEESAEVFLNGTSVGKLIGPVYQIFISAELLKDKNTIEVKVTNGMANRIADMDKKKIPWKKFYNVNFPSRKPENRVNGLFDASGWSMEDAGVIGPVRLIPCSTLSR